MLIPALIKAFESDMHAMGMKLTAQEIYDVNNSSLKDAILHFGGGCTAELVSNQGLLLTNHHCGYSQIQSHSSLENNYLKNGFWAKNKKEELANPGLTASRVVRIQDVTETVLFGIEALEGDEKAAKMQANIAQIKADAERGVHYTAKVKAFNYGNEYYMIVKETFLMFVWLEHLLMQLVNLEVTRIIGCGQDIQEIFRCFAFMRAQIMNPVSTTKQMCRINPFISYRYL